MYPQFATHNAETLATIYHLGAATTSRGSTNSSALHGMGEPLYEQVVGAITAGKLGRDTGKGGLAARAASTPPWARTATLLAYLVRRLLENGANTSFVNRIADETIALDELVNSPRAGGRSASRHRRHCRPAPPAHSAASGA